MIELGGWEGGNGTRQRDNDDNKGVDATMLTLLVED
jgi:hypothetical protein